MQEKKAWLDGIQSPDDVKAIPTEQLDQLCDEIRKRLIENVSQTGGHLSSNLGVVELTVALLRNFTLSKDSIVWDVGHQCYPFKMLTGRLAQMSKVRKLGGVSGFPNPKESEYDSFVVGHSSTSVSAANGIAKAKKITGDDGYTVAVIGDGALTGGLAYEGLSNAGRSHDKLIVVLNDNQMSIGDNVGFAARHLTALRTRPKYVRLKKAVGTVFNHIPLIGQPIYKLLLSSKSSMKRAMYKDVSFFEDMGFYYLGPIDGHDMEQLTRGFATAKMLSHPVVMHVETVKGKGYAFAEQKPDLYHGVGRFDPDEKLAPSVLPSFSSAFGETLNKMAQEDPRIVGITAAMQQGTGMENFAHTFPYRCFDTGIAEAHAVTFASGLSTKGVIPIFAVYSTFLQRAYDQLLNDTAIMNNHIVLAVDRAGIVSEDGETHQGIFDVAFLTTIPNVTMYSPATFKELELHLKKAVYDTDGIAAVRYPRGGETADLGDYTPVDEPYTLWENENTDTLMVTYGRECGNVIQAAKRLHQDGTPVSVMKLNRIFPLEDDCLEKAIQYSRVIFVEEGIKRGGLGEYFAVKLMEKGFQGQYKVRAIETVLPPCSLDEGMQMAGLDADSLYTMVTENE